jgi:hypothetical protein
LRGQYDTSKKPFIRLVALEEVYPAELRGDIQIELVSFQKDCPSGACPEELWGGITRPKLEFHYPFSSIEKEEEK